MVPESGRLPNRRNLLRVLLGTCKENEREEQLMMLETNIDDLSPEVYDYVMERLFAAGAGTCSSRQFT